MATLRKLKIAIKTSASARAGTDASIYLVLVTPNAGHVYRLPTRREEMEGGSLDTYPVELQDAPDLTQLQAAFLVSSMQGRNPSWRVLWVNIEATDATGSTLKLADAMLEQWLDTKDGHAPLAFVPLAKPFTTISPTDTIGPVMATLTRIIPG